MQTHLDPDLPPRTLYGAALYWAERYRAARRWRWVAVGSLAVNAAAIVAWFAR